MTNYVTALFIAALTLLFHQTGLALVRAIPGPSISNYADVVSEATQQEYREVTDELERALLLVYWEKPRFRLLVAAPFISLVLFSVVWGIVYVQTQPKGEERSEGLDAAMMYCTRFHVVDYLLVCTILVQSVGMVVEAYFAWIDPCELAVALATELGSGPGSEPYDTLHEKECEDPALTQLRTVIGCGIPFLSIGALALTLVALKNGRCESPEKP